MTWSIQPVAMPLTIMVFIATMLPKCIGYRNLTRDYWKPFNGCNHCYGSVIGHPTRTPQEVCVHWLHAFLSQNPDGWRQWLKVALFIRSPSDIPLWSSSLVSAPNEAKTKQVECIMCKQVQPAPDALCMQAWDLPKIRVPATNGIYRCEWRVWSPQKGKLLMAPWVPRDAVELTRERVEVGSKREKPWFDVTLKLKAGDISIKTSAKQW